MNIIRIPTIGSTNAELARMAFDGAPDRTVLVTDSQTSGRGRQGRTWLSEPGSGLCFSVLFRPKIAPLQASTLPLVIGCAVAEAVERFIAPVTVGIKWPNDLLVNERKLCGILCEMQTDSDSVRYIVAGIGLNVNLAAAKLPAELADIATSMRIIADKTFDTAVVLDAVLQSIETGYDRWLCGGLAALLPEITARDALFERTISMTRCGETLTGTAAGIAQDGALLLRDENCNIKSIYSGEAHITAKRGADTAASMRKS